MTSLRLPKGFTIVTFRQRTPVAETKKTSSENLRAGSALLFWRERGHNFLKAGIAAERVPEGQQL
jgi:hypothetical protein